MTVPVSTGGFAPMPSRLRTPRLLLRLRDGRDAWLTPLIVAERVSDPTPPPPRPDRTPAQEEQRLDEDRVAAAERGFGLYTVRRVVEGDVIGYCGLVVARGTAAEPELAYELLQRAHGHGYATEASRAVVQAAAATGRSALHASVRSWNTASLGVLGKLGFVRGETTTDDRGELVSNRLALA